MAATQLTTDPDWSEAPEWAQWFAIDEDGEGFWSDYLPTRSRDYWMPVPTESKCSFAGTFDASNWEDSIQQRPL